MSDETSDTDAEEQRVSESAAGASHADEPAEATDGGTAISGDEGFEALTSTVQAEQAERERELTEAEKTKRRIMRKRSEVDLDAPPITVTVDEEQIAFSPMPKKVRAWMENTSFEFLGLDEDTLADDPERGEEMRLVKDKTSALLAEHARAAAYDADFWAEWLGVQERMELINQILEAQDRREGNRR